ncbi:MAG TPA: 5'-3' exonuclease H3TH domain-containing protein, partial [Chroococcidiopsis sp.]
MSSAAPSPILLLIDGHSLAFRSYFAHAKGKDGGLRTSTGIPTSASYGFLKSLLDTMEAEKPEYVAIAFDLADPTFRHEAEETYKAGRAEAPEDFFPDLANLQELLTALNLPIVTVPKYEADDVIGTLARKASSDGYRVKVLTGDRDMFQLVDPDERVTILYLSTVYGKGTPPPREFGVEQVKEKMGIWPAQVVDYKALCGDASDNIPGVKGIGDKTAVQLLTTYGSLDKIYASLEEIKGATRKKLEEGRESALRSQYLAQIHLDVPLDIQWETCKLQGFNEAAVVPLLEKLEFRSFLKRIQKLHQQFSGDWSAPEPADSSSSSGAGGAAGSDRDPELWFFSAEDTATAQQHKPLALNTRIIDTPSALTDLVALLRTYTDPATPVAWDTETTALDPRDADLVGIGCCWGPNLDDVAYIPIGHRDGSNLDKALVLDTLRPLLESADYPKALQNAKFDRLILRGQGVELAGVVFDTMLASYVLNPDDSHNLSDLGQRYLNILSLSYSDLVPKGKTIADLAIADVANYCGTDAYTVFGLVPLLRQALNQAPRLHQLLLEVEQPVEPVLADMEYLGVRIDL